MSRSAHLVVVAMLVVASLARADEEVVPQPTGVRVVRVERNGAWVRWRPDGHRMAMMRRDTRVAVRGLVSGTEERTCRSETWYAIEPRGYVCADQVVATTDPPGGPEVLEVPEGSVLPHRYAVVRQEAPVYADADAARAGNPLDTVTKGTRIVLRGRRNVDGHDFVRNRRGRLIPREAVGYLGRGSQWQGVFLHRTAILPFGWTTARSTRVHESPDGRRVDRLGFRTRIVVLEERDGWIRIGPDRWVRDRDAGIVRRMARPAGTGPGARWIDVDQGEQTLVAYEGDQPIYATLVSGGRRYKTPMGNYPIWAKIAEITMDNQPYEDNAYTVEGVPWVLFFQEHNAIHGTYWHDAFGRPASHGCINLSPRDARFVYDWALPPLPPGWQSFMPDDLRASTYVHVRNSLRDPPFRQQRRIGPPDPAVERRRAQAAERRRAEEAARAAEAEADGLGTD